MSAPSDSSCIYIYFSSARIAVCSISPGTETSWPKKHFDIFNQFIFFSLKINSSGTEQDTEGSIIFKKGFPFHFRLNSSLEGKDESSSIFFSLFISQLRSKFLFVQCCKKTALQNANNCCNIQQLNQPLLALTFLLFTGRKARIQARAKPKRFQNAQDNKPTSVTLNQASRGGQMATVNRHPLYQNGHGVHGCLHELQQASRMRDDLYVLNKFVRMAACSLNCNLLLTKI